jgi:RNA polymerase sigma factor (sigma-70 family)
MSDEPDPELLARLEQAMMTIPARTREIFLAHRVHGLSYREISAVTGLSVRGVQKHMARALYGLDRALEGRPLRWWERWFGL